MISVGSGSGSTLDEGEEAPIHTRDMEHRARHQDHIVWRVVGAGNVGDAAQIAEEIVVGELHAFGQARCAGCVELDDVVIQFALEHRILVILTVAPALIGFIGRSGFHREDMFELGAFAADGIDCRLEILADEQDFTARIVQSIGDFRRSKTPVDAGQNGAGFEAAQDQFIEMVAVLAEETDARVGLLIERQKAVGHLVHMPVQFAEGRDPFLIIQRDRVRPVFGLNA